MHKWKNNEVNKKEQCRFEYFVEQFSDIKVFAVPNSGWEDLTKNKTGLLPYSSRNFWA
jgi:hypothetical protein